MKLSTTLMPMQAWFVAGIFVLLALPVSIYEVAMQLEYFSRPTLQIRVIRILWMVPIYALDSWFALRFKARPGVLHSHDSSFPGSLCVISASQVLLGTM